MSQSDNRNNKTLGLIIAGGSSARMSGHDKFLLTLGNKRIIDHVIERFSPQVDHLILNINGNIDRVCDLPLEVVPDSKFDKGGKPLGPLCGIYTALKYAKEQGFSSVVTTSCDTPFLPDDFVSRLFEKAENDMVIAKGAHQIHPVHGLWNISLMEKLEERLDRGSLKMMDWINTNFASEVSWNDERDPFFNINSQTDLIAAEKMF